MAGWTYCGPDGDGPTFADTVEAFAQADGVGAIAACVDAIGTDLDGRALMRAAEAAADAGRPLVVLATGADRVIDAVLRQAGVIRVDGFDQLLDCAATLARFPRPAQRPGPVRVAADSGGAATLLADLARRAGLEVEDAGHTPDAVLSRTSARSPRVPAPECFCTRSPRPAPPASGRPPRSSRPRARARPRSAWSGAPPAARRPATA